MKEFDSVSLAFSDITSDTQSLSIHDIEWLIYITFRDEKIQGRFQRFRLYSALNNFPFYSYMTWCVAQTLLLFFVFSRAISHYEDADDWTLLVTQVTHVVAWTCAVLNTIVLFLRTKLGLAFINHVSPSMDKTLYYRNVFEEFTCCCRSLSIGLILIMRCYIGTCSPNLVNAEDFVMCNTNGSVGSIPGDTVVSMVLYFILERYFFSASRLFATYFSWLIGIICAAIAYGVAFQTETPVSLGMHLAQNFFYILSIVGLGPYCYYHEKSCIEKYLYMHRENQLQMSENMIEKSGERHPTAQHDATGATIEFINFKGNTRVHTGSVGGGQDADSTQPVATSFDSMYDPTDFDSDGGGYIERDFSSIKNALTHDNVKMVSKYASGQKTDDLKIEMTKLREVLGDLVKKSSPNEFAVLDYNDQASLSTSSSNDVSSLSSLSQPSFDPFNFS